MIEPLPPTDLGVVAGEATSTSVSVSWILPGGVFDLFKIEYSIGGGPRNSVEFIEPTTSYTLENLLPGTSYDVFVTTVAGRGATSIESDAASFEASTGKFGRRFGTHWRPRTRQKKKGNKRKLLGNSKDPV